jgi:hypothetical protein
MNRTELLARADHIAAYYGQGQQIKSDIDSWLTCCPAHKDSTPSLHLSVTDRLLVKCHAGCPQAAVINQMKADGMWVVQSAKDGPKPKGEINIPAHRVPDFDQILVGRKPPDKVYTYVTEDNQPAFWVLRVDPDKPGGRKQIRPYSSVHYDDGDRFELALNCNTRPLYRLYELVADPDKSVLVVEGEKTVEAAQEYFGEEYIVTTWAGGTGGVKKTVWEPLKDRKVVLWPDNDEPGIRAMKLVASLINGHNEKNVPSLVLHEVDEVLPEGWDLADKFDPDEFSPESLLSKAEPINFEEMKSTLAQSADAAEWIKRYEQKYLKVLEGGSLKFYNLRSMSAGMEGVSPFSWIGSVKTLKEVEPIKVFDVFSQKQKYAIDYWLEDTRQPMAVGLKYDPSTKERLIRMGENLYLNTFPGFAHEPVFCEPDRYMPFINHIKNCMNPDGFNFMLNYVAHMVQLTRQKPGIMVILTGKPGVGKTIICDIIAHMLGKQNATVVDAAAFTQSNFNGLFSGKLFVTINELNVAYSRDHTLTGKIKSWITDENYTVNAKFMPQRNERSYHRFIATTNSDIPFPIDYDDRRIALFKVNNPHKDDITYFRPLFDMLDDHKALSGLMQFFMSYEISDMVIRPPETEERRMSYRPEDDVISWLYNVLQTGVFPQDVRDKIDKANDWMRHGVVIPRSVVVDSVLKQAGMRALSPVYITRRLTDHIPRKTCLPNHVNNQIFTEVYDKVARTYTKLKDRVFEFLPLMQQREVFEAVIKQEVVWNEVQDDEPKSESNVVPFPDTTNKVPF